jgi:hypothetical protein
LALLDLEPLELRRLRFDLITTLKSLTIRPLLIQTMRLNQTDREVDTGIIQCQPQLGLISVEHLIAAIRSEPRVISIRAFTLRGRGAKQW